MRRALPLILLLAACGARSPVAELEPGLFALTSNSSSPATAARRGVTAAEAHCAQLGGTLEPVRSEIGVTDYRIAFRCADSRPAIILPPPSAIGVQEPPR
jgi:putative hemolysin